MYLPALDWSFSGANTKSYTHCFHIYPAMMIPQIPRRLIRTYLNDDDRVILDPYCGSGTTIVEANLANRTGIGIDINPLALMIAQAKVTRIDRMALQRQMNNFANINRSGPSSESVEPDDYWFPANVIPVLRAIKNFIGDLMDADLRRFFTVAFSETVRDVSYVNKGGYKRHRMKDIEKFQPDAFGLMWHKVERNAAALHEFMENTSADLSNVFLTCNTVHTVEPLRGRQVDAIITSPPYGDSRTTVAYGEFSSFALQWLGYDAKGLDRSLMGGGNPIGDVSGKFPAYLNEIVATVADEDPARADDIKAFYADYRDSIDHVATLLPSGGIAAYVVGNRIVKNQKLPTDRVTAYFFEQNDYEHIETIIRAIPTKRMPRSNSPSNIAGMSVSTMNEEYIVVMRKR